MQTFPPLCVYNFGLPRRTLSPRPPTPCDFSTPVRPPYRTRPPSLPRVPAVPPAAVRGHVWTTYAAMAQEQRWTFPRGDFSSEVDGAELTRTTNAAWAGRRMARRPGLSGNWRRPGLGGDWPAWRTSKWREGKKRVGAIGEKKIQRWGPHFGFAKSKCKVLWSWTIFRLCKWVWDFANNNKCKIHLQSLLEML